LCDDTRISNLILSCVYTTVPVMYMDAPESFRVASRAKKM
jgi:hypothetical protein